MRRLAIKPKVSSLTTLIMAVGFSIPAWAIDLQPGDATAPPPGLRSVQLSYLSAERVGARNAKLIKLKFSFVMSKLLR